MEKLITEEFKLDYTEFTDMMRVLNMSIMGEAVLYTLASQPSTELRISIIRLMIPLDIYSIDIYNSYKQILNNNLNGMNYTFSLINRTKYAKIAAKYSENSIVYNSLIYYSKEIDKYIIVSLVNKLYRITAIYDFTLYNIMWTPTDGYQSISPKILEDAQDMRIWQII